MKGLSLFSNIGIAEATLEEIGLSIDVANEISTTRVNIYRHLYPDTEMIHGDIRENYVFNKIIKKSKENKIEFVIATPPCQGMSTVGKQNPNDERNNLIFYAIKAIKKIKPRYVLIENVPQQLRTKIFVNGVNKDIPEYLHDSLSNQYHIEGRVINCADYGVPQIRKRSIFLLSRKDQKKKLTFLNENDYSEHVPLSVSIGKLPSLDPKIQGLNDEQLLRYFPNFNKKMQKGISISKWHRPPIHKIRHVEIMQHTPEGKSAFGNKYFYPKKSDGSRIKGYKNTYKRQSWDRPSYTITNYNGAVCSQDNVHPGKPFKEKGKNLYSDARVFSIYELMILMSLPPDWNIPEWADESHLRHAIGEGLPPIVVNKIFGKLLS